MPAVIERHSEKYFKITGIRYRGENYIILSNFPDTSTFRNGVFWFKPSHRNIDYIAKHFPDSEWRGCGEVLEDYLRFVAQEELNLLQKEMMVDNPNVQDNPFLVKTKPFDHQLTCLKISHTQKFYGLLFEQGCGKTKVIIDNCRYLFDFNEIDTLIVIAPNGVHDNWIDDELPIHMAGGWCGMAWRSNFNKKRRADWDKLKTVTGILKVFAFNVETFASTKGQAELISILKGGKCMLAIDESQKIKNPAAKRTKFICKVGELAKYRRILTGTPVTKGAEDFYSQLRFLCPDILGINSFTAFKRRYCDMGGFEMKQIVGYRNMEELQRKVEAYTYRVLKKDCLDLPDKIYQFAPFDLTKKQQDIIKQIKQDGVAELNSSSGQTTEVIMEHVITRMVKMQQVANGYFFDTESETMIELVEPKKNPRLLKFKEIVGQVEGKIVIWTKFRKDVELISSILKKGSFLIYDGSVDADTRKENKKRFQTDPEIEYFIVNQQAGATGLTLTQSHTNIYYNNTYDLELRLQSEDRTHRIGTIHNVLYIDLIANKTPEKKIITALKKKKSVSDLVLKDPARIFLEEV